MIAIRGRGFKQKVADGLATEPTEPSERIMGLGSE